jgi:dihydrofolate synthase / folylpolyglutamate synthase
MTFDNVEAIRQFVYSRIVRDRNVIRYNDNEINKIYLDFFEELAQPQQKIKVIHVAGTSGKGSTCNFISHILVAQGCKVGMTISPFIEKFQERIQINNRNLSDEKFVQYFNFVYQCLVKVESDTDLRLSTFEILTGLTYYSFWKEKVDYAIIEVGMGGRLDGTNVINNSKLCVLNSIGLDHQKFLGDTIELIALEKAGIMQPGNTAIALSQTKEINQVFQAKADELDVELEFIFPNFDFGEPNFSYDKETKKPKITFEYNDTEMDGHIVQLSQIGDYQAANCALAIRVVETIADRDGWEISWEELLNELKLTTFNARFQLYDLPNKNLLILDGAHNPQKMKGFTQSVAKYYPDNQFNWVIAFKGDKDATEILDLILENKSNINKIILTEFDVNIEKIAEQVIVSKNSQELADNLSSKGFVDFEIINSLDIVLDQIKNSHQDYIITGSLYLIGAVLNQLKSTNLNKFRTIPQKQF